MDLTGGLYLTIGWRFLTQGQAILSFRGVSIHVRKITRMIFDGCNPLFRSATSSFRFLQVSRTRSSAVVAINTGCLGAARFLSGDPIRPLEGTMNSAGA